MEDPDYEESVMMNALGPHFYVDDSRPFTFPEGWRDGITDVMNQKIVAMNERLDIPVTHEHIKEHVEITTVQWNEDGDDFEIQPFGVNDEWYSDEELYDFDF